MSAFPFAPEAPSTAAAPGAGRLPSFSVGPVTVAPGLALAPMSGVTDSPFRQLVKLASGDAVGLVVSEFISIELLTRRQLRTAIRMSFAEHERPVSIQLYGADVDPWSRPRAWSRRSAWICSTSTPAARRRRSSAAGAGRGS